MAWTALRAGRHVMLANSRGPDTLDSVIASLPDGASAGTVEHAAGARVVVLAVPWPRRPGSLHLPLGGLGRGGKEHDDRVVRLHDRPDHLDGAGAYLLDRCRADLVEPDDELSLAKSVVNGRVF
jgi:NADP oxidoreductase coenzyme F420-dependent